MGQWRPAELRASGGGARLQPGWQPPRRVQPLVRAPERFGVLGASERASERAVRSCLSLRHLPGPVRVRERACASGLLCKLREESRAAR